MTIPWLHVDPTLSKEEQTSGLFDVIQSVVGRPRTEVLILVVGIEGWNYHARLVAHLDAVVKRWCGPNGVLELGNGSRIITRADDGLSRSLRGLAFDLIAIDGFSPVHQLEAELPEMVKPGGVFVAANMPREAE